MKCTLKICIKRIAIADLNHDKIANLLLELTLSYCRQGLQASKLILLASKNTQ